MQQQTGNATQAIDAVALSAWVREFARLIAENRDHLNELDSANGDADHGSNLDRGMAAVLDTLDGEERALPAALLKDVGVTLVDEVGGSSGALYGTIFLRLSGAVGGAETVDDALLAQAFRAAADGVAYRGSVKTGDKTMYDALAPAVDALDNALRAGRSRRCAWEDAARAAEAGRDGTIQMQARKGKSSYVGEKSAGSQDPGATSLALLIRAAASKLD